MFTVLATALALSAPVPKAVAPELKWKFTKGETVYVTASTESTSAVQGLGGGNVAQKNTSTVNTVYKLATTAVDDKGVTLELTYLSVQQGVTGLGVAAKLADVPGVAGKVVTLTLDKDHKITKVVGAEEGGKGGVAQMLQEDYLRYTVENLLRAVPGKAVGKGDSWTCEEKHPLSDGVLVKRSDRGTVTGTEDGLVKLEVDSDHAMTTDGNGNQPFRYDLKGDKGKRTVLFDGKVGRVRKLTEDYTVVGTIDIGNGNGGGGNGQSIQLSTGMKATITVSDTEPKDGK